MRPVFQTRFGYGDGNCLMASACSIVGVELEEPDGMWDALRDNGLDDTGERTWWALLRDWAAQARIENGREIGYTIGYIDLAEDRTHEIAPAGFSVMQGTRPDGIGHAVVAWDGLLYHDPNPNGVPLASVDSFITFLPVVFLNIPIRNQGPPKRDDKPWEA